MALHQCKECGKEISTSANACPNCGKEVASWVSSTRTGWLVIVIVLIVYVVLSNYVKEPQKGKQSSDTSETKSDGENAANEGAPDDERREARTELLVRLQRLYAREGLDIQVSEGANRELILTTDLFKDVESRDEVISGLVRDEAFKSRMCIVGFWELNVGYSKGLLSRDVTRRVSLNCPEERKMFQAQRDKWAAELQSDFDKKSLGVKVIARGTTLVFKTGSFSRAQQQQLMQTFISNEATTPRLCTIGFKRIETQGAAGSSHGAPLPCAP